jgi:hypothetical protein
VAVTGIFEGSEKAWHKPNSIHQFFLLLSAPFKKWLKQQQLGIYRESDSRHFGGGG